MSTGRRKNRQSRNVTALAALAALLMAGCFAPTNALAGPVCATPDGFIFQDGKLVKAGGEEGKGIGGTGDRTADSKGVGGTGSKIAEGKGIGGTGSKIVENKGIGGTGTRVAARSSGTRPLPTVATRSPFNAAPHCS